MNNDTPMMAQWRECKRQAKEALLLFRLGDFYEAFYEDAELISKEINLTLTARQGIAMCGVPFHSSDIYIDKLLAKGYKIAIAEQMEDPKEVKRLVKREVIRIITPGTVVHSQLLAEEQNNFFICTEKVGALFGAGILDLSTSTFRFFEVGTEQELYDELCRLRPKELLTSPRFQRSHPTFSDKLIKTSPLVLTVRDSFSVSFSEEVLLNHFKKHNLDCFGLKNCFAAIAACASLLLYLRDELSIPVDSIKSIQMEPLTRYMSIDYSTMCHLELAEPLRQGGMKATLIDLLDATETPMGARLLRHWVKHPLRTFEAILSRQKAVTTFLSHPEPMETTAKILSSIHDLERMMSKISSRAASPRDLQALALSLMHLPLLKETLQALPTNEVQLALKSLFNAAPLAEQILSALSDQLPLRAGEGGVFRTGYHEELDQLRTLAEKSASWVDAYQERLREETKIKTLKIGFTRAFGYYVEVGRAHSDKLPSTFFRKQTLTRSERFFTEELKQFEEKTLTAAEQARALEIRLFEELRLSVVEKAPQIQEAARAVALIDSLLSLAIVSKEKKFVRPTIDDSGVLEIQEGRHPIVEASLEDAPFIPNDTLLNQEQQMMLITGPNMAGKSTYLRQVALIVILAQIGCYVPAASARVGIVDKLFSRIGASDELTRGQSTFMVEMSETANILHNATSRSLVLLDEVGRGTSTYDGIAIAWSVAEFLLTTLGKQAKTLFATHYWELTHLEEHFAHARNFQVAVKETDSEVSFLHKIVPGHADKSYGVHVAKLAGMPFAVVENAKKRLCELEKEGRKKELSLKDEFPLFALPPSQPPPFLDELKALDPNQVTPLEALQKLFSWHNHLHGL